MQYIYDYQSPIGHMILESDGKSLVGLWLDSGRFSEKMISKEAMEQDLPVFEQTRHWLDIYFKGEIPDFTPPLCTKGSDFRERVWKILREIPYGQTITYGEIARKIAKQQGKNQMSAQAVGGAVGHNPISIIIPCHRVVGSNGSLTGYGGGIDKKVALLSLEKVDMKGFFVP